MKMSVDNTIHNAYMTARNGIAKMLSRLVPPKEVDDILQDTYVRLCQVKDPSHIREPRSFLYKTARNLAYDHLKRADVRLIDDAIEAIDQLDSQLDEFEDETLRKTASQQEFAHFCDAVRLLPPQCRRAFVLKKVYGHTQKAIASELGISEKTVEKHIAEGVKRCTLHMRKVQQRDEGVTGVRGQHNG